MIKELYKTLCIMTIITKRVLENQSQFKVRVHISSLVLPLSPLYKKIRINRDTHKINSLSNNKI